PEILIISTGSIPQIPEKILEDNSIKNIDSNYSQNFTTAHDVLRGTRSVANHVVIIGGGATGAETAEFLAIQGKKVILLELSDEIAKDIDPLRRPFLLQQIEKLGITIILNSKNIKINNGYLEVEVDGTTKRLEEVESIVFAVGVKSDTQLKKVAENCMVQYYIIGDADQPGNAMDAVFAGAELALRICNMDSAPETKSEKLSNKTISELAAEITRQIRLKLGIDD
ncbi:MAG: hypothetical protein FJW66_06625, partial [Actinobacteria bacterium]|nr:hypothetical protein [Actinomycetota bacterium]